MSIDVSESQKEPYVGPRAFKPGETLYGREREARQLVDLLFAERIVLLYSPSGAGKTSLIQALLSPLLVKRGFRVLPTIRLANPELGVPTNGVASRRYIDVAMSYLEDQRGDQPANRAATPTQLDFASFLGKPSGPEILIFDQFEEILTLDPTDDEAKQELFNQVGEALRDRLRWALFSMREDYVPGLDPYLHLVPTGLATRFRLELLGVRAAREAIQRPPEQFGVHFSDEAATRLVDDLRVVQVQLPDGTSSGELGQNVEPLQLQVVCQKLWTRRDPTSHEITLTDLGDVRDVDNALGEYYSERVSAIASQPEVSQRAIREWVESALITPQGLRGQVLQAPRASQGLNNGVIQQLVDAYVVRAERRHGATWYELTHDRLVKPIQKNNAEWFARNLTPFQVQADLWQKQGRLDGLLLRGDALRQAEASVEGSTLTPVEFDFLKACRQARQSTEHEQRRNRQVRSALMAVVVALIVAGGLGLLAAQQWSSAATSEQRAVVSAQEAQTSQAQAQAETTRAVVAQATAEAEAKRAVLAEASAQAEKQSANDAATMTAYQADLAQSRAFAAAANAALDTDPDLSILLGLQAVQRQSVTREAQEALQRALQGSRTLAIYPAFMSGTSSLAISDDGQRVAAGSAAGVIKVWDWPPSGPERLRLDAQNTEIGSLAFTPDGTRLASGTTDGRVTIWDAESGSKQYERVVSPGPTATESTCGTSVKSLAFSPDGTQLAVACYSRIISIWDATLNGVALQLEAPGRALSVAYDPTGDWIAIGDEFGFTTIFDAMTGATVESLPQQVAGVARVAFNRDGTHIATAGFSVQVFDTSDWQLVLDAGRSTGGGWSSVAFSPNGAWLASGGADRLVHIWDIATGENLFSLAGHADYVRGVVFDTTGQRLVSASDDGKVRVWNVQPNGFHMRPVQDLAFSSDGSRLATGDDSGNVEVWDAASRAPLYGPLHHDGWVYRVAFDPAGGSNARLVTASADHMIRVWSNSGQLDASIDVGGSELNDLAVSSNGTLVAAASRDGFAHVYDLSTLHELQRLAATTSDGEVVYGVAFSPDGKMLATGASDGTTELWDAASGNRLALLNGGGHHAIWRAAFSPDGKRLATTNYKGVVDIYGVDTEAWITSIDAHAGRATSVAFSPDGQRIATSGEDHTVKLWKATPTGEYEPEVTLPEKGVVLAVSFSPDGRWLASGGEDHELHLYPVDPTDLINIASQRPVRTLTEPECRTYFPNHECPTRH